MTRTRRVVINDAMDIHAGSAICKGENNLLEKFYRNVLPIGITVEGSNVLTKNLIIFGQGLNKSHPYIFPIVSSIQSNHMDLFYSRFTGIVKHSLNMYISSIMCSFTTTFVHLLLQD